MNIAIYTLTSELHDEQAVGAVTKEFLDSLDVTYELKGNDYTDSPKMIPRNNSRPFQWPAISMKSYV